MRLEAASRYWLTAIYPPMGCVTEIIAGWDWVGVVGWGNIGRLKQSDAPVRVVVYGEVFLIYQYLYYFMQYSGGVFPVKLRYFPIMLFNTKNEAYFVSGEAWTSHTFGVEVEAEAGIRVGLGLPPNYQPFEHTINRQRRGCLLVYMHMYFEM